MEQDQLKALQQTHQAAAQDYMATGQMPQGFEGDPMFLELIGRKAERDHHDAA